MSFDCKKLYDLLPAYYREQDQGQLKALISVIAEQIAVLEDNLDQLYDDQFIETCAEWVVPYIGDLIGTRGLHPISDGAFSQRAEVANTIGYRRRKGTASVVQQLAQDTTGWNANVVEYFDLLAGTQYMNHLRSGKGASVSLRDGDALQWVNTPFDPMAHTVDVRSIALNRGKYNIPNLGIFLWRIQPFSVTQAPAYQVVSAIPGNGRQYLFNALGKDTPLYQVAQQEHHTTRVAVSTDVPMPIGRRVLSENLAGYYGETDNTGEAGSLQVFSNGAAVPQDQVSICDLSDVKDQNGNVTGWNHLPEHFVAIDPVLGRLAFPLDAAAPAQVNVSYYYGFPAPLGGGEYERTSTFTPGLLPIVRVPSDIATIQQALNQLASSGGVVEIQNNDYYLETPRVQVAAGTTIELRAADNIRPLLVMSGPMVITGGANGAFSLNGLLVTGGGLLLPELDNTQAANQLFSILVQHCTIVPGPSALIGNVPAQGPSPGVVVESPNTTVTMDQCICGPCFSADTNAVTITDSILDAGDATAPVFAGVALSGSGDAGDTGGILTPGAPLTVENATLIGKVYATTLAASNTIFMAALSDTDEWPSPVLAERLQEGCTRFCYVPPGSKVPRPYRCQPAVATNAPDAANAPDPARVRPVFTSLAYGDAGYCQLSAICAPEIGQGADDGSEMGAYHQLYEPQRIANLQARLDEYLRFGLEAGIFLAS